MQYQGPGTRKPTGGRRRRPRDKRKHELGHEPTETQLEAPRIRTVDAQGTVKKVRALSTNVAEIADGGETKTGTIEDVVENPANPNYVRRNIITKGAIIETDLGRARVTSRPGQTGQVNAVLIDE